MGVQDILPVELNIPNRDSKLRGAFHAGPRAATEGKCFLVNLGLGHLLMVDTSQTDLRSSFYPLLALTSGTVLYQAPRFEPWTCFWRCVVI